MSQNDYTRSGAQMVCPSRQGCLQISRFACKEWRCLLLTLLIVAAIFTFNWDVQKLALTIHYFLSSMMLLLLYSIYVYECWNSETRLQLSNTLSLCEIKSKIHQAIENDPKLWWICLNYHYTPRTRARCHCRPRYTFQERQRSQSSTATHVVIDRDDPRGIYNREISSSRQYFITQASLRFSWCDKSPQVNWTTDRDAVEVIISKEFVFADEAAMRKYKHCKAKFAKTQESKDEFMELKEGFQLGNESELSSSFMVIKRRPALFRQSTFMLLSLCLLSWPLRTIIYSRTEKMHLRFTKQLQLQPKKPSLNREPTNSGSLWKIPEPNDHNWQNNEAKIVENPFVGKDFVEKSFESDDEEILSIDIRFQEYKIQQ